MRSHVVNRVPQFRHSRRRHSASRRRRVYLTRNRSWPQRQQRKPTAPSDAAGRLLLSGMVAIQLLDLFRNALLPAQRPPLATLLAPIQRHRDRLQLPQVNRIPAVLGPWQV
jgi:hypothetical protein